MFVAGYATEVEIAELMERGWEVEPAEKHGLIGPEGSASLMTAPTIEGTKAVVVFVDAALFDVMNGSDWPKRDNFVVGQREHLRQGVQPLVRPLQLFSGPALIEDKPLLKIAIPCTLHSDETCPICYKCDCKT